MLVTVLEKDTADAVAELSKQGEKAEKNKVEEARTTLVTPIAPFGTAAILLSW